MCDGCVETLIYKIEYFDGGAKYVTASDGV